MICCFARLDDRARDIVQYFWVPALSDVPKGSGTYDQS